MAAVDEAAAFQSEVILLDLGMPKLNGLDACRQIRNQPGGKHRLHRLLIALTGWGQEDPDGAAHTRALTPGCT